MEFLDTESARYLISDTNKPCTTCGKLTNQIEITTEARFCSDKCCEKWYTEVYKPAVKEIDKAMRCYR